jgi:hypothetical protein
MPLPYSVNAASVTRILLFLQVSVAPEAAKTGIFCPPCFENACITVFHALYSCMWLGEPLQL